jgi:4-amino-4-deoxy-L-arabinose transferase-like glycosyltransferase
MPLETLRRAARSLESAGWLPRPPFPALLVGLILLGAAALRFWSLGAGLPYAVGVDEPQIMERVVRMMKTGDFNPHFFDWPSLTIYLHLAAACITFLTGAMRGYWSNLDQINATDLYLASRSATALLGTATVALTYLAGRRWGTPHALLASALMAVIPNHVRGSHYVQTDVPTGFLTTLTFLLALRANERRTAWAFAHAGFAAGLAASAKYNGLISITLALFAVCLSGGTPIRLLQRTLIVCAAAAGAFLLGTPYALLDLPRFLNDYARLAAVFAADRAGEPGWLIYLKHLRIALASPALVLAFAGLAAACWHLVRGPDRVRWVLLVTFPLIYFFVMAGSYQIYGRYMVPIFPFAALLAAIGVMAVVRVLCRTNAPRRLCTAIAMGLVVIVLAGPTTASIASARDLGRVRTVELAYRWITEHVPPGSKIAIEAGALVLPDARYRAVFVPTLIDRSHEQYVAEGFDYLFASSERYKPAFDAPHLHRAAYNGYQTLFVQSLEVASFEGSDRVVGPDIRLFRLRP